MLPIRSNYSQQVANDTIRYCSWILYADVSSKGCKYHLDVKRGWCSLLCWVRAAIVRSEFIICRLSGRFDWIHYSSSTNVEYPHDVASSRDWSNPVNAITTVYRKLYNELQVAEVTNLLNENLELLNEFYSRNYRALNFVKRQQCSHGKKVEMTNI